MIWVTPINIATKSGLVIDAPPRPIEIIPMIIINTEPILDMFSPENIPIIPIKISRIPII